MQKGSEYYGAKRRFPTSRVRSPLSPFSDALMCGSQLSEISQPIVHPLESIGVGRGWQGYLLPLYRPEGMWRELELLPPTAAPGPSPSPAPPPGDRSLMPGSPLPQVAKGYAAASSWNMSSFHTHRFYT